jgi:hypothetical protein
MDKVDASPGMCTEIAVLKAQSECGTESAMPPGTNKGEEMRSTHKLYTNGLARHLMIATSVLLLSCGARYQGDEAESEVRIQLSSSETQMEQGLNLVAPLAQRLTKVNFMLFAECLTDSGTATTNEIPVVEYSLGTVVSKTIRCRNPNVSLKNLQFSFENIQGTTVSANIPMVGGSATVAGAVLVLQRLNLPGAVGQFALNEISISSSFNPNISVAPVAVDLSIRAVDNSVCSNIVATASDSIVTVSYAPPGGSVMPLRFSVNRGDLPANVAVTEDLANNQLRVDFDALYPLNTGAKYSFTSTLQSVDAPEKKCRADLNVSLSLMAAAGVPIKTGECPSGYFYSDPNLCVSTTHRPAATWPEAQVECRKDAAHICGISEIFQAWNALPNYQTPNVTNPNGLILNEWIGATWNQYAVCLGSTTDQWNVHAYCSRNATTFKRYRCCQSNGGSL